MPTAISSRRPTADPDRIGAWITGHNLLHSPPFQIDRFGLYSSVLTHDGSQYALVFMGVLLVLTVLMAPNGLVLGVMNLISRLAARRGNGDA